MRARAMTTPKLKVKQNKHINDESKQKEIQQQQRQSTEKAINESTKNKGSQNEIQSSIDLP